MSVERFSVSSHCLENNSSIGSNDWASYAELLNGVKHNECSHVTIENETLLSKQTDITLKKAVDALKDLNLDSDDSIKEISWTESEKALFGWNENECLHDTNKKLCLKDVGTEGETFLPYPTSSNRQTKDCDLIDVNLNLSDSKDSSEQEKIKDKQNTSTINFSSVEGNWVKRACNETKLNKFDSDADIRIPNFSLNHTSITHESFQPEKTQQWRMCEINTFLSEEELSNIAWTKPRDMLSDLSNESTSLSLDSGDSGGIEIVDRICAVPVNCSLSDDQTLKNNDLSVNIEEYYMSITTLREGDKSQSHSNSTRGPDKEEVSILKLSPEPPYKNIALERDCLAKDICIEDTHNTASEHQNNDRQNGLSSKIEVLHEKPECKLNTPTSHFQILIEKNSMCDKEVNINCPLVEKCLYSSQNASIKTVVAPKFNKSIYSSKFFKQVKICNANSFDLNGPVLKWSKSVDLPASYYNSKGGKHLNVCTLPEESGKHIRSTENADGTSTTFNFSTVFNQPKDIPKMKCHQTRKTKKKIVPTSCLRRSERLKKRKEAGIMVKLHEQECSLFCNSIPWSCNSKRKKCSILLHKSKRKKCSPTKIAVTTRNNSNELCYISPVLKTFMLSKLKGKYKTESSVQSDKICSQLSNAVNCSRSDYETHDGSISQHFVLIIQSLQAILFESGVCKTVLDFYSFIITYTPFYFQNKVLPLKGYFSCSGPIINNKISEPLRNLYKIEDKKQNKKSKRKQLHD